MRMQNGQRGFSLLEMMIAIAIFTIVSGAALSLFVQNEPVFTHQQNQAALNIAIRNSIAQMQMDVTNAGYGFYTGTNISSWPVGITIYNNVVTASNPCNTPSTYTYGPNCFDILNVVATDPNTPPAHPSDSTGAGCTNLNTSGSIYLTPVAPTTEATLQADYHTGDEILLVTSSGQSYSATVVSSSPSASGSMVKLTHATTNADGSNTPTGNLNAPAIDPLNISTVSNSNLGVSFCPTDWVMRLTSITYTVDTSNPADPQLDRCINSPSCTAAGSKTVLADQVIGFKVGAVLMNSGSADSCNDGSAHNDDTTVYHYNVNIPNTATPAGCSSMFMRIRSVQISLIGRTNPSDATTANNYRNGFDGGPYQIEGLSIVVNPRNMSMNNN